MAQSDNVESLVDRITALQRERERLHERAASREELEENRRAIATTQSDLSLALVARHGNVA